MQLSIMKKKRENEKLVDTYKQT